MAQDEDQEAAAALAKLAGQDPAAAEDARAALEWIAGEQGRAFITQERICCRRRCLAGQGRVRRWLSGCVVAPRSVPAGLASAQRNRP